MNGVGRGWSWSLALHEGWRGSVLFVSCGVVDAQPRVEILLPACPGVADMFVHGSSRGPGIRATNVLENGRVFVHRDLRPAGNRRLELSSRPNALS